MWTDLEGKVQNGIAKVSYSHEALIDLILAKPMLTQREMAKHFGYTEAWISQIISSDSFQVALTKRKDEVLNPLVKATVEERFKGLVGLSITILEEKLEAGRSAELALGVFNGASRALGYGARGPQVQVNNYVAVVPARAKSSKEWIEGEVLGEEAA